MAKEHPDADWIRSILDRFEGPLISYATRLLCNVEAARDVVQETFLTLCRERRPSVESHVAEWLFTVCRNKALNQRRKDRRLAPLDDTVAEACVSLAPSVDDLCERADTVARVHESLRSLSDNQQEVIRLKFQHGFSYREISRITGLSVSNVGYLLVVGLRKLREQFADNDDLAKAECEEKT